MHAIKVRLAHVSDIHVAVPKCHWRAADWASKRLTSWFNLRCLGRGWRFRNAERVLAALDVELREQRFDHLLFSGDATSLGFEEEVARAASLLGVGRPDRAAGLAVPGNHDYCTGLAQRSGAFERHFAPWQTGERVDGSTYPFAQRVGPLWLVALNSATANRGFWDASGQVGPEQRQRLEQLLARLDDAPRVLVTHYPIAGARGQDALRVRELRDLEPVLDIARRGGVRLWLHGHNHGPYHLPPSALAPFPVVCAGSVTQEGLWTYCDYTLSAERLVVQRRVFDPTTDRFQNGEKFDVSLKLQ